MRPRVRRLRSAAPLMLGAGVGAAAVLPPFHELSEQFFSVHMVQHELLMTVAAPLVVLGYPVAVGLRLLPRASRRSAARLARPRAVRRIGTFITNPPVAWLLHAVAIWLWHLPILFERAIHNDVVHAFQHLSFISAAVVFWWAVLRPARRARRGLSILLLFTTAIHTGVLGALMTFAHTPWYRDYASRPATAGLSPLADQQLAGMIMWIPGSLAYLIAALFIVRRWLAESEWEVARGDRPSYAIPIR